VKGIAEGGDRRRRGAREGERKGKGMKEKGGKGEAGKEKSGPTLSFLKVGAYSLW